MIFRISLLAIIAAIGGRFVEARKTMCLRNEECTMLCLMKFGIGQGSVRRDIDLVSIGYGLCQEDLMKLEGLRERKDLEQFILDFEKAVDEFVCYGASYGYGVSECLTKLADVV
eukprot:GHVS01041977.1.p1 GENE.GHVS01041977.1~~GHVS01041977.1.p1  ORF type:complete len:114 (+),score=8.14 GHVS01041977.1:93-434(+)